MINKEINTIQDQTSLENTITAVETPNLISEIELDILNYLRNKKLESIIADGLNPEHFTEDIFSEHKQEHISVSRLAMEGIKRTWEKDTCATSDEIALNSKSNEEAVYAIMETLNGRAAISIDQVTERLEKLRQHKTNADLSKILIECQSGSQPVNNKIDFLRKNIDDIQCNSELLISQSHSLHKTVEEIKNPKNKPIPTGFVSFDKLVGGGLKKTEVGILAGGAGVGKSAFALQLADMLAANGTCVLYYSIEIGIKALTRRSLLRLSYEKAPTAKLSKDELFDLAVGKYATFCDNLFLIKGRNGMTVSEIRGKVLSIKKQRAQDLVLIIDPFQRLGTGNEKIDCNNETIKVGRVISDIKQMAEDLEIPILALSDTVKNHKDNTTGEGASRSSYMIDHVGDYTMMLRTSTDPLVALYGGPKGKESQDIDDPFMEAVKNELNSGYFKEKHKLISKWDRYAALVTPKVRDHGKFSPLFVFHPAFSFFEETSLWESILPVDDN